MITNTQISDFAKRKTEAVAITIGRELTAQERSQCHGFFSAFGRDFKLHQDRRKEWDSKKFWTENAPEIVKALVAISETSLAPAGNKS